MNKLKLWMLGFCLATILLDKFSFISKIRDYTAVYIQKQTSALVYRIKNYPKLVLLQKTEQRNLETENIKLKQDIQRYSILLNQQKNLGTNINDVESLTTQSGLYSDYKTTIVRAVIDINYLVNNKLLIDKGTANGITIGNAAINQFGIIGQVFDTNNNNAQVILVTNPSLKIYLQTTDTKSKMLAQGIGNNSLIVKYLSKQAKIKVGDILVTTGLDDIYPANIPVAKITKIFYENNGFNSAICQPIVDYNKLQYIAVLKNARQ